MSEINDTEDIRLSARVSELLTKADGALSTAYVHAEKADNPHLVTKEQVGLGKADNTADMDKPVSMAAREALNKTLTDGMKYTDGKCLEVISASKTYTDEKSVETISACKTYTNEKTAETKMEVTAKITQVETNLVGLGESMVEYVTGIYDNLMCMKVQIDLSSDVRLVGIIFQRPLHALDTDSKQYLYRRFVGTMSGVEGSINASAVPLVGVPSAYPFTQPAAQHAFFSYNMFGTGWESIQGYEPNSDLSGYGRLFLTDGKNPSSITLEILSSAPKVQEPAPEVK